MNASTRIALAAGCLFCGHASANPSYQIVDLSPALPGSSTSSARAINNQGDVAIAFSVPHDQYRAAVWSKGVAASIPTADGNRVPAGIDGAGNTVGSFVGITWGWFYRNGSYVCVPEPDWCSPNYFYASTRVYAMNDAGSFTGVLSQEAAPGAYPAFLPQTEAFLAVPDETGNLEIQRLGLFGDQSTAGWGVNESGDVAGAAGQSTNSIALLFRGGDAFPLPDLGGPLNRALAVNDTGLAVGFVSDATQTGGFSAGTGAVWMVTNPEQPVLMTIGQLDDSNQTWLFDINDAGVAVGTATRFNNSVAAWSRPVIWTPTGGLVDANNLIPADSGWVITGVNAVNQSGQIAATARLNGSQPRAVRLDPVTSNQIAPLNRRVESGRIPR
jgi:hypothetical protein